MPVEAECLVKGEVIMALKAILNADEHGALGDELKGEYKEVDGKFILDVVATDGYELSDVSGLKTTMGKEIEKRKALEKQVVKFKDIDPERAREALAKLEELETLDPSKDVDKIANTKFEAAKAQLLKKHTDELSAAEAKSNKYRSKIEKLLVDQVATAELAAAKGSVELLLPHIQRQTRVVEDDDDFKVEVVDKDGSVRIGDSKGTPMGIKELIAEMRASETFGLAFEGEGITGGGKKPSGGNPPAGLKRSQMTPEQKREYQQKHGQEAFLKLPR